MTIARVRSLWVGPQIVGGGVTDLYFFGSTGDEAGMMASVRAFWNSLASQIALTNTVTMDPNVVNLNEGSGDIVSVVTIGAPPAPVTGTAAGDPLPPQTQGLVQWFTTGIVANRRVRGRTFIPAPVEVSNTAGAPAAAYLTAADAAGEALIADAGNQLVVWSRPTPSRAGSLHPVSSSQVWVKWAVLRSRRDA